MMIMFLKLNQNIFQNLKMNLQILRKNKKQKSHLLCKRSGMDLTELMKIKCLKIIRQAHPRRMCLMLQNQ